nr:hypothetical protein Iba_chr02eCG5060 [Ipomoea batatas]
MHPAELQCEEQVLGLGYAAMHTAVYPAVTFHGIYRMDLDFGSSDLAFVSKESSGPSVTGEVEESTPICQIYVVKDRRPPNLAGSDDFSTVQPVAVVAVPLWLPQIEAAVTHPSSATFNFTGSAGFAAVWSVAVVAVVTSSSVSLKSLISSLL